MNTWSSTASLRPATVLSYEKVLLWTAGLLYVAIAAGAMLHHVPWGDEIHRWNIAKGSASYADVIYNSRFEGHPPTWYTIMWIISRFTHNFLYVQVVHLVIASATVFLLLFYSPLPLLSRLLIPFGYYFLFEFAVLTRNYAIGVLLVFCICGLLRQQFKYKAILYYALLLLLSNGHLFALLLAGSLHLYYLWWNYEQYKSTKGLAGHMVAGLLVLLPSLYFIFPPSGGALAVPFWLDRWNASNIITTIQSPIRSMIPVPAWWEAHWWNTEFLMQWQAHHTWLKYVTPFLAAAIVVLMVSLLWKSRKSLLLFGANLLATALVSIVVFPLGCARYAGLIFIGFLAAWWLYCYEYRTSRWQQRLFNVLLVVQIVATAIALSSEWNKPFSNFNRVGGLIAKAPAGEKLVCDYWGLNAVAAFTDRPLYCIDLQREVNFLLWDEHMARLMKLPHRYADGAAQLFQQGLDGFWMISSGSPAELAKVDDLFQQTYNVALTDSVGGAIEKGGNVYLYRVEKH